MNHWRQLGKKRGLLGVPLRATSLCVFRAITFLLIARTCLTYAVAQVTPVPPFVGTNSETWEEFGVSQIPSGTSILGGIATISGDHMVTAMQFDMCGHIGVPSDGDILMGSARPTGPVTISFSQAVSAFGAYWGSSVHCYSNPSNILTFRDAAGNIIGTDTFRYNPGYEGDLLWHGYQFGTPVTTITRTAGDGQDTIVMDGLQANLVGAARSLLGNISTRALVQTGDNVMIGGFIVQGTTLKRVIIRAIGPELSQYGVPNPLADPTLELHDGNGALIASNDNWQTTIIGGIITQDQVQDIQNSGHAPGDPSESAIIANLPAGNYTAIVRGVNSTTGVALVEVYDLSPDVNSILGNISTRSFVQTGDNVMIGGFIVQGTTPKSVIIRAIGPELSQYGVPNPLANPTLELHDGNGALIASNDNWQTTIIGGIITQDQVQDIQNSGHAPGDASESAIIANLPPGNYTAIVRGVNNTIGVALVEAYDLH